MTIQGQMDRISGNIADTYAVLNELGATAQSPSNSNNLARAAASIGSDATATAATIRSGYSAYVKGQKVNGTLANYTGTTSVTSNQTLPTAGRYCPNNIVINVPTSSGGGGWDEIDTGLEFRSVSSFTINVQRPSWDGAMEYLNSESGWQTWDGSEITSGETATGHYIFIRGTGNTKVTGSSSTSYKWTLTGSNIECNGNIERLLDYATVENGLHPTMANNCYDYMFYGCTSLTTAPVLPATTLTDYCYSHMFYGCTSLTTAPTLPATTLTDYCYYFMFRDCTSLTTAPALPATTLKGGCYYSMFYNCTSLTAAPSLPATTLEGSCYGNMFFGCTSLTTAPALPATTLKNGCYNSMFYGCTSLTTVPALPATTLTIACYNMMFIGCTKIKVSSSQTGTYTKAYRIPASGTGTTVANALLGMFNSTGGTFTGTPTINTTYYLDESNSIISII